MVVKLHGIDELIACKPGVQGGQPCIAGTGVTVFWIAWMAFHEGRSLEEIREDVLGGTLRLAQIHAALAYYLVNQEAIDEDVDRRDRIYDEHAAAANAWLTSQP